MQYFEYLLTGVLLLFAAGVCSSEGSSSDDCVPSHQVACITLADIHNASGHVSVFAGKNLIISMEDGYTCQWTRNETPLINGSQILNIPALSEADSGNTLCNVKPKMALQKRPTKPQLTLNRIKKFASPWFKCITDGFPKPTLEWSSGSVGKAITTNDGRVESEISSIVDLPNEAMCCAFNEAGRECSQLFDITDNHNITLSPGQSLLMRCTLPYEDDSSQWQKDNKNEISLLCSSETENKACILPDEHYYSRWLYLAIPSLNVNDSGTYTCRGVSVHVSVQKEGFLSVELKKSLIVKKENVTNTCLDANVFYHPFIQDCTWETPDKMEIKCLTETWVTKQGTLNVKLCDQLKTGEYRLHIEAGGRKINKSISLCIVEKPDIKITRVNDSFIATTISVFPANYAWMGCSNYSCEANSWSVIPQTLNSDLEVSCNKIIRSPLKIELVSELYVKFCLNNSFGQWCTEQHVHTRTVSLPSIGYSNSENSTLLNAGSIFLLLLLSVVTGLLLYFIKRRYTKPKYEPQLQMIQMVGPNDNDYIYINFKDFAYDSKWEFPRENLELARFWSFWHGVQATAYGINKPGVSQQVAVKMLKEKHQAVEKEALMSELKMLTHIGHHSNVVNLLGACTETGPIYLIFQFCCYGDLLNYLKNNSQRYHKSVTDAFMKDRFSSLYHNLQSDKPIREMQTQVDNYVPMHSSTTRGQENIALLTLSSTDDLDCFEDTDIYESPEDADDDLQALTFDDLLSFAYQVAKGMEFLSSKNCIHRDLAARNVLVTKGRMAKIGDFGLARDIDNDSNYVVRGNVRLPVKWMAPESIFKGMYTTKSDVWAYGILLWEIFSLGVTPYPGMKVDHTFYAMIERGFKMECPYYANESVYNIMCQCWELDSCNRPSFSKLLSFMAAQLTEIEEKLYQNTLDSNSNDYQNMALMKQTENKSAVGNDYCPGFNTEVSEGKVCTAEDGNLQNM
ncbi:hypothetical protein WMY93_030785 [Mugilogobius chulae]|uniref:receptor protein-tyrosine kinase n=1 Tax=Mugilogobius chulae TaxID=88201 RepID=A0AAW0MPI4_9GOBI